MNPHKVKIVQEPAHLGGLFRAYCSADACDAEWGPQDLHVLYRKVVQHQTNAAHVRDIYRRTDWQEPVEDT